MYKSTSQKRLNPYVNVEYFLMSDVHIQLDQLGKEMAKQRRQYDLYSSYIQLLFRFNKKDNNTAKNFQRLFGTFQTC